MKMSPSAPPECTIDESELVDEEWRRQTSDELGPTVMLLTGMLGGIDVSRAVADLLGKISVVGRHDAGGSELIEIVSPNGDQVPLRSSDGQEIGRFGLAGGADILVQPKDGEVDFNGRLVIELRRGDDFVDIDQTIMDLSMWIDAEPVIDAVVDFTSSVALEIAREG